MNKKEIIERVISIAKSQVGTTETPKGSNKNKYSQFFDDLRKSGVKVYNYAKNPSPWCDQFCDYCYIQATSVEIGLKMIYQPMESCGAGCKFSAEHYRKNKAFFKTPEIGDQIFFGDTKAGTETHTGIVVKLTEKMIYTVEGNVSNMVKEKSYNKNQIGKKIVGFGRPNWEIAVKDETPTEKPTTEPAPKPTPKPTEKPTAKKVIVGDMIPTATKKEYARTWTVIAKHGLNLRKGNGTNYAKMAVMPYGTKIKCSGKYAGVWLNVTYETDTAIYSGFCSIKYLK